MKHEKILLRRGWYLFVVLAAVAIHVPALGRDDSPEIWYRVRPIPAMDRTDLEIAVRLRADSPAPFTVRLPVDCFGMPDILYRSVTKFEGNSGTSVRAGQKENERVVQPSADGSVALSYTLSYDPAVMQQYPYSPNTGPEHFHVGGCQWLLRIGHQSRKWKYSIEIEDGPADWKYYSSSSPDATKFESVETPSGMASSGLGGGKRSHFFQVQGKPVSVFVHGGLDIPDGEIFSAVEKIVRLQRDWFGDYSQPFYTIAVAERAKVRAGYAPTNGFFCFVKKDIALGDLNGLLSHEMSHTWLHAGFFQRGKDVSAIRHAWFYEGVNDYIARRILLDSGLMTFEAFVESFNRDITSIADNPYRAARLDELVQAARSGNFGQARTKLSYSRGALMALAWEARILKFDQKRSLGDLVREASVVSKRKGLTEEDLFRLAGDYGIDVRRDFESYILRGKPIALPLDAFGRGYRLQRSKVSSFDPGFALEASVRSKNISGVRLDGPAYRAGLRDGMKLVDAVNANRYGNLWDPKKPMTIVVEIGGRQRQIEFFPHGGRRQLKLFDRVGPSRR